MPHSPIELWEIHAAFGTAEALVKRRRATYSAVIELLTGERAAETSSDLLDSPTTRAHLAEIITKGSGTYQPDVVHPLSRLAARGATFAIDEWRVAIVSDQAARVPLEHAMRIISLGLGGGDGIAGVRLLLDGDTGFDQASRMVLEGLELASSLSPRLVADLLPHVMLFAIAARDDRSGTLGSASVREYPGLIVLPEPEQPIDVAEALVHEGAHQKFFDLGMTRSIFNADFCRAPLYTASWAPSSATSWPLEQCLAAFHAYSCLAVFQESAAAYIATSALSDFSLLPVAAARASELGTWARENASFLGPDGRHLVGLLSGKALGAAGDPPPELQPLELTDAVLRTCGAWTLVARMDESIELFWVHSDDLRDSPLVV